MSDVAELFAEPPLFDTEYVVISKTIAKPVGIISEQDIESFFKKLVGHRQIDWQYHCAGTVVEWSNMWDSVNHIRSHCIFMVMPVNCIPANVLSEKLKQFSEMGPNPAGWFEVGSKWFEQYAQRIADEDDVAFEYRLVRLLAALFKSIKNKANTTP
jgi:hypothetical protein